jgi:hypothetical protein
MAHTSTGTALSHSHHPLLQRWVSSKENGGGGALPSPCGSGSIAAFALQSPHDLSLLLLIFSINKEDASSSVGR